jgi:phage terminase large subunit GpA-like protein
MTLPDPGQIGDLAKLLAPVPDSALDADERGAWQLPPSIPPSAWAESNRYLTLGSPAGPWRGSTQPVLNPLIDVLDHPGLREIWIEKCKQIGGSEIIRNYLAYLAHMAATTVLYVMPNERDGKKQVRKYMRPLFDGRDVPVLAPMWSRAKSDNTTSNIRLVNGFDLQLAFAGSEASLSSEPRRVAFLDEVNIFEAFKGTVTTATNLARNRLTRMRDISKLIGVSSPTHPDGEITREVERADLQLRYYAVCPACSTAQTMVWDRVRWPERPESIDRNTWATRVRTEQLARYVCGTCEAGWDDRQRRAAIEAGYWALAGIEDVRDGDHPWRLYADGRRTGEKPPGSTLGVRLHGLLDVGRSLAYMAGRFIAAVGRDSEMMDFKNAELGETFHFAASKTPETVFERKCKPDDAQGFVPGRAGLVPAWACRVLMSIDTQKEHFYVVVRAFGPNLRSRRVWHGKVPDFEGLAALEQAWWPSEDPRQPRRRVFLACIDTGGAARTEHVDANRTEQTYQWCAACPTLRIPMKGASRPIEPKIRWKDHAYLPRDAAERSEERAERPEIRLRLYFLDPVYWRDLLSQYVAEALPVIDATTGEVVPGRTEQRWELNDLNDAAYNRQMASMHRVMTPKGPAWSPHTHGQRHDFHDCEQQLLALAHGPGQCLGLPDPRRVEPRAAGTELTMQGGYDLPIGRP